MVLIRPEVAMYAAFARLNYRPWFALSEFVDNSIQSAMLNLDRLSCVSEGRYQLVVEIDVREDYIEIRDNAGGIAGLDYDRAFLPASPPPDTSGLSEFGLGMKAAACWFSRKWSVRTTALGEDVERSIYFDIPAIVNTGCEYLEPVIRPAAQSQHYTTIRLQDLNVRPRGKTVGKIKDHLTSIYRLFLRDGLLELRFNGEPLHHEAPAFLEAPYYATPDAPPLVWRKELSLELGDGHSLSGWAALLARASVANAGFAVFRRRRLILGTPGEGYRPEEIFGASNKFVYQRLVGELNVEGFSVSHTKDGLQWEDWEDEILSWLKNALDEQPLPLLEQADNHRARAAVPRNVVVEAAVDTSRVIAQHLPPVIDQQVAREPDDAQPPYDLEMSQTPVQGVESVELRLEHAQRTWNVKVELVQDPSRDDWYELAENSMDNDTVHIQIRVNVAHPFMVRFLSPQGDELIAFTRLAAALAISELTAREAGARMVSTLRMNLNQILRVALAGPIQGGEARSVQR